VAFLNGTGERKVRGGFGGQGCFGEGGGCHVREKRVRGGTGGLFEGHGGSVARGKEGRVALRVRPCGRRTREQNGVPGAAVGSTGRLVVAPGRQARTAPLPRE
jgi:hypothetical protein